MGITSRSKSRVIWLALIFIVIAGAYIFLIKGDTTTDQEMGLEDNGVAGKETAAKETKTKIDTSSWNTYTNEKKGFSVKYPADLLKALEPSTLGIAANIQDTQAVNFTREIPLEYTDKQSGNKYTALTNMSVQIGVVEATYEELTGSRGTPITIGGKTGVKGGSLSGGRGVEIHTIKKDENSSWIIRFDFIEQSFFNDKTRTLPEYISLEKQRSILEGMLSTLKFMR